MILSYVYITGRNDTVSYCGIDTEGNRFPFHYSTVTTVSPDKGEIIIHQFRYSSQEAWYRNCMPVTVEYNGLSIDFRHAPT